MTSTGTICGQVHGFNVLNICTQDQCICSCFEEDINKLETKFD